jgi:hypothetical protein
VDEFEAWLQQLAEENCGVGAAFNALRNRSVRPDRAGELARDAVLEALRQARQAYREGRITTPNDPRNLASLPPPTRPHVITSLQHLQSRIRHAARHRAMDILEQEHAEVQLDVGQHPPASPGTCDPETLATLRHDLAGFPAEQRRLLSLHHAEGRTLQELRSLIYQNSVGLTTVYNRLERARQDLLQLLTAAGYENRDDLLAAMRWLLEAQP